MEPLEYQQEWHGRIGMLERLHDYRMKARLWELLMDLSGTPELRSKYSRTITAISVDLGLAPESPGSGVTPDITLGNAGKTSSKEE